nr:MAG TPA: Cro/C1-type HTH DNA-binding domain protein [Bacteriophage sp.]
MEAFDMNMPILNKLLGRFDFRKKHNRTDLNIQAVDQLREAMESKGIRQKDIAEKLGISPAAVSKTLSMSEKNLELNTIADLATAMDMRFSLTLELDPHCSATPAAIKKEFISYRETRVLFNTVLDGVNDLPKFGEFREISVSLEAEGV